MIIKTSYSFMKPPPSARLIRGHRLAQGLAGLWTMAENGGLQVFDLSGGNHGTIINATWVPGKFGSAIDFDGSGDYVNYGNNASINIDRTFTIIAWIKTSDTGTDNVFISKGSDAVVWWFLSTHNERFRVQFDDGSVKVSIESITDVSDNQWYQVAITRNSNGYILYVDAIQESTAADNGSISNSGNLEIGGWTTVGPSYFTGQIDHVLIYNRALSASEIAELYWRPFCMFERKARTALMSGYEVVAPPVGMAGAMTTNSGYWGW